MSRDSKKVTLELYNNYENSNKKLLKILDEFYGINDFLYQRIYWDGRYFFLGSTASSYSHFNFMDYYIDNVKTPSQITTEITRILAENKENSYSVCNYLFKEREHEMSEQFSKIIKHSGCKESVHFITRNANYYELSTFAIHNTSLVTSRFVYENTSSLLEFFNYFKIYNYDAICKAESLITTKLEATELLQLQRNLNTRNIQEEFTAKLNQSAGGRTFSPREIECIFLIKEGLSYKEIALKLNVSLRTIEHHIENIKLKTALNFKNEIRDIV